MGPGRGWRLCESDQLAGNHLQASVLAQRCQEVHNGRQGARTGRVLGASPPTSTCLQAELGVWAQSLWSLVEDQKGGAIPCDEEATGEARLGVGGQGAQLGVCGTWDFLDFQVEDLVGRRLFENEKSRLEI